MCARRLTQASVNSAKGNFDGPRQDYQIDANDQITTADRLQGCRGRLQQWRAGVRERRRQRGQRRGEHQAGRVDGQTKGSPGHAHAGRHSQHSAPARRQHHHRRQRHPKGSAAAGGEPSRVDQSDDHDRHDHQHSGVGARRGVRAGADHRAGGHGDLSSSCAACAPPSFPAWRSRFRSSAPSP